MWYLCLYATDGVDVRRALRSGASREEIAALLRSTWTARRDRGAEDRLVSGNRSPLIPLDRLRRDLGINLAGIAAVLDMRDRIEGLQKEVERLRGRRRLVE